MRDSRSIVKRSKLSATVIAAVIGILGFGVWSLNGNRVSASSSGPTPGVTGAPGEGSCVNCHADFPLNSGTGNISIIGLPKNYLPGQAISVTVRVEQAKAVIYGFQLTAIDKDEAFPGSFSIPNANPQPLQVVEGIVQDQERKYVEHTQDGTVPKDFGSHSWTFTFNAPSRRIGKLRFYAAGNAADSDFSPAGDRIYTTSAATLSGSAISNYDDDTVSDFAVFRPSNGTWYARTSGSGLYLVNPFGLPGDVIAPGDYDGDGITDRVVWRPSNATWYFETSSGAFGELQFGMFGDVPVAADYDGDLKTDFAVWRPSIGTWFVLRSTDAKVDTQQLGHGRDRPVPADYDGDAKADLAVFRPSQGVWYMIRSSDSSIFAAKFGFRGDEPVPGDYDGDGRNDLALYRPNTSVWYILTAENVRITTAFGVVGDEPSPGDFDGDGKTDIAVFRNGTWYFQGSEGGSYSEVDFGLPGDIPIVRGYLPRG